MSEILKHIYINDKRIPFDTSATEGELEDTFLSALMPHLRPARKGEFNEWLDGNIARSSENIVEENYLMNPDRLAVLEANVRGFVPLHGVNSLELLVPKHVAFRAQNVGHCVIYLMEDYTLMYGNQRTRSTIYGNPLI